LILTFILSLLAQVYEFVGVSELYYAGSHGMDIIGPPRQSISGDHPDSDKQVLVSKFPPDVFVNVSDFTLSI